VRSSERLTESAVCLVAAEGSYDRQLEKILQGAGRIDGGTKPVLEINPEHAMIQSIAATQDAGFREDAVLLLLDQARVLDGEKPADPRAFAERLQRVFARAAKA
jgi:molecular chaperone HtpG